MSEISRKQIERMFNLCNITYKYIKKTRRYDTILDGILSKAENVNAHELMACNIYQSL